MSFGRVALFCALLLVLSASASARALLKHGKHGHGKSGHGHGHGFHGGEKCHTILDVLHGTPSLARFSKALDDAKLPFLSSLFGSPYARATFLAVQDEHLGAGDTVFSEANVRFMQHTVMDKVKTCHAKNGDKYTTLANTGLRLIKADASVSKHGRKLSQLSTAWTSLMAALPLNDQQPEERRIPDQFERRVPDNAEHHGPQHLGPKHGQEADERAAVAEASIAAAHATGQGAAHMEAHEEQENDDDDDHHKKEHAKKYKKKHAKTVADQVARSLQKTAEKEAKHGAVYLHNEATSQRVKVLGTIKACEGEVLIVSAFLNAPPTPDVGTANARIATDSMAATPLLLNREARFFEGAPDSHVHQHQHHHHHHHTMLGHLFHGLKHAFKGLGESLDHFFWPNNHAGHRHCKHAKAMRAARAQAAWPVNNMGRLPYINANGDIQFSDPREEAAVEAFSDANRAAVLAGPDAATWFGGAAAAVAQPELWRTAATSTMFDWQEEPKVQGGSAVAASDLAWPANERTRVAQVVWALPLRGEAAERVLQPDQEADEEADASGTFATVAVGRLRDQGTSREEMAEIEATAAAQAAAVANDAQDAVASFAEAQDFIARFVTGSI